MGARRRFDIARRLLGVLLLLGQRDRQLATERLALPLVAGTSAELDVDPEGLRLAGLEDAEVPSARGQIGDRGERDGTAGLADADPEVLVGHRRVGGAGRVVEVAAEHGDAGDGAVVADGERLRLHLAGLEAGEVEVDRAAVVLVADAERQRRRRDRDLRRLGVGVVGVRSDTGDAQREDSGDADTRDGGRCELLAVVGDGRGHDVPSLQQ